MENSLVILDSSALVSLSLTKDTNYKTALEISDKLYHDQFKVILPADIFTETVNVLGKKTPKTAVLNIANKLLASDWIIIEETSNKLRLAALEMLSNQSSKMVSFTDCIVMAIARAYDTNLVFSFDEHFKKNGFVRVGIDKKEEQ